MPWTVYSEQVRLDVSCTPCCWRCRGEERPWLLTRLSTMYSRITRYASCGGGDWLKDIDGVLKNPGQRLDVRLVVWSYSPKLCNVELNTW